MEYFDLLDENGNFTGKTKLRTEVHRDGDWHKAVHIWIINNKQELLLQKRSPNKDSNPNMWDISCAGHLSAGDENITGAIRELEEELDIKIEKTQLEYITTIKKSSNYTKTFINNEFNDIYIVNLNIDISKIKLQEEELTEVKFIHYIDLEKLVNEKTPDILIHKEEYQILFDLLHKKYDK